MYYKDYEIILVCANFKNGIYEDIYISYDECRAEHPNDTIKFGYFVRSPKDYEDVPDWFNEVEEAIHWIETR